MTNLIRRKDVMALWEEYHPYIAVKAIEFGNALKKIPSVEPKKGKWIEDCACSECGWCNEVEGGFVGSTRGWNFCPNCGADMREQK